MCFNNSLIALILAITSSLIFAKNIFDKSKTLKLSNLHKQNDVKIHQKFYDYNKFILLYF